MTHSFKKIVSILLVAMLLVSVVPAMFVTTASAVASSNATAHDGTGLHRDGAVMEGADFRFVATDGARTNFSLEYSDGTVFKPTVGQWYTVSFDVYYDESTTATSINWADGIYMGNEKIGGDGRISYGDGEIVRGYEDSHITDGQWHTVSISFVGKEIKAGNGTTLEIAYFTMYSTPRIEIHFKNVKITEGAIYDETIAAVDQTLDISNTVKDDGTTKRYDGSSAFTFSGVDENGNLLVTAASMTKFPGNSTVGPNTKTSGWYQCLLPDTSLQVTAGRVYTASFKYKVTTAGTDMYIGIGTSKGVSTGSTETYVYGRDNPTEVSADWVDFTCTFTAAANGYIKISLNGTNASYVISDITVHSDAEIATKVQSPAYKISVNDNGELKALAVYPGDSLSDAHICDGAANINATNAAMGEKLMGWYSDPHFTTEVATAPAADAAPTILYAKYPSTVIDFNYRTAFTSGYGVSDQSGMAMSVSNAVGVATVKYAANVGFMLPSYDAAIADNVAVGAAGYGDAYYKFTDGVKYKITFKLNSVSTRHNNVFTCGSHAGSKGARNQGSDAYHSQDIYVEATTEPVVFTHEFTVKKSGYDYIDFRTNQGSTDAIDCIIITDVALLDEMNAEYEQEFINGNITAYVTLDYNNGSTPSQHYDFTYGQYVNLPVPTRDGYIFAGWYKNYQTGCHSVSTDDIPLSFIIGDWSLNRATLTAQWVKDETITVDFSEPTYWNSSANDGVGFAAGHASKYDASSKFTVEQVEGLDADGLSNGYYAHFNSDSSNMWKISLFNDDGSRVLAMNGITYNIKIRYKVVTATDAAGIGVCRNGVEAFGPCGFDNNDTYTNIGSGVVTDGFVTAEKKVTAENMYRAENGPTEGLADKYLTQIGIRINKGEVYIDYVEVTPESYTPAYQGFDATKGDVTFDYLNKTVTVTPKPGYKVASSGVSVQMTYRDYEVKKNDKGVSTCYATKLDAEKIQLNTVDGLTFTYAGDYSAAKLNALKVTVNFVAEDATNAAFISGSTRDASGEGETYVSAGIRFRVRVDDANIEGADKVEFVIVPEKSLNGHSIKYYMENDGSAAVTGVAYSAADSTNVVYEKIGGYTDYQAVVTGLTKEDNPKDLTALKLCAALRITKGDSVEYVQMSGAYAYTDLVK